jgi:hypothetical protein
MFSDNGIPLKFGWNTKCASGTPITLETMLLKCHKNNTTRSQDELYRFA